MKPKHRPDRKPKNSKAFFPQHFEEKVGYHEVQEQIAFFCANPVGKGLVFNLHASTNYAAIRHRLQRAQEMMALLQQTPNFPVLSVTDLRATVSRIARPGSRLEEEELYPLYRAIELCVLATGYLQKKEEEEYLYPALAQVPVLPEGLEQVSIAISNLLDKNEKIKDHATPLLAELRTEKKKVQQRMGLQMQTIWSEAVKMGYIESDMPHTIWEGRPVLPVIAGYKSKVSGLVHGQSATGKTLFIEPLEIVESNNRLREVQAEEERELIRILTQLTDELRPFLPGLEQMYLILGRIDALYAIAKYAIHEHAAVPRLHSRPQINWLQAIHPLLRRTLAQEQKEAVPLSISLHTPEQRILLISGPNAGGKSVCLKTVGLLQYMLQCGIPIPVSPDSEAGVFESIALSIGDDQSIENDLSTYSSHLKQMKHMAATAGPRTLLLIDEFGGGTEPEIGGAIAEGLLKHFSQHGAWGVITTHYRNLKEFAEQEEGVVNGAMLYNKQELRPLFVLSIGHPGSSFAIEIARKQGLPNSVLQYATDKVGKEVIQSDRYVQEIVRDKQEWQSKRARIENQEQKLESVIARYEQKLKSLQDQHQQIVAEAQQQATTLVEQSRSRIERTIREIVESKAEKEATKQARKELETYASQIQDTPHNNEKTQQIEREIAKLQRRAKRKNERKKQAETKPTTSAHLSTKKEPEQPPQEGDKVLIIPKNIKGVLVELNNDEAIVALGDVIKITCNKTDLKRLPKNNTSTKGAGLAKPKSNLIEQISTKRAHFSTELDLRGMRVSEADSAVQYYIDDAIALGVPQVRILHGTGTGALREAVRSLLAVLPGVASFHDEDVRYGGAGITVVQME